jgi:hypothetical protein
MENSRIYKRQFREQSAETKQKISNSMKDYHKNKGVNAARACASKQSQAMKRYWQSIPSKSEYQKNQSNLTMQQFLGVKNDK